MWFECIAKRIRSLHDSAYSNQNFKSNTWHTIARVKNNQNNASSLASMLFWHCTLHVDYITTSSALWKLHDMFHAKFSIATHATRLSTSKNKYHNFSKRRAVIDHKFFWIDTCHHTAFRFTELSQFVSDILTLPPPVSISKDNHGQDIILSRFF